MSNASEARRLLRAHRYGALSTLSKKLAGFPFGSITPYLLDHDGSLIIFISALAEHSKNIRHDPRVSLITHNQQDPRIQMQGRVTVAGTAHLLSDPREISARYLRHFPEAADLMSLDFSFYRIQPVAIRYIGGVGRIHWVRIEDYAVTQAAAFAQNEEGILNLINTQHDLPRLLLEHHQVDVPNVQATGLDCDGLDVCCGEQSWRLDFVDTLTEPAQIKTLSAMCFHAPSTHQINITP